MTGARDWRVFSPDEMKNIRKMLAYREYEEKPQLVEAKKPPAKRQLSRTPPKVGRNECCPCGSGLKFKRCHLQVLGYRPVEAE